MGTIEQGLDASTIFAMDQTEAHAMDQLRELADAHRRLSREYGDNTSPMVLATVITEATDQQHHENPEVAIFVLASIIALATTLLVQFGWPDHGPVPVSG